MRTLNLANYATFYESIKNGYISEKDKGTVTPAAVVPAGPKNPAAVNLVINTTDSEALKAIKTCIRDMEPADAYKIIEDQSLALSSATSQDAAQFSVNIGGKDIKIVLRKLVGQVNGKTAIKPAFDSVTEVIGGMDIDYICTKIYEAIDGIGTDEESLAAICGAVISYAYANAVSPKEVWKETSKRYQETYGEDMIEAITGDFTGNPKVFAKGMFGGELTPDDFSGAAWGELATDPLLWAMAAIQVGTTVASAGLLGPEWAALDAAVLGAEGATAGAEVAISGAAGAEAAAAGAAGAEAAAAGAEVAATGAEVAATGTELATIGSEVGTVTATGAETVEVAAESTPWITDMVQGADGIYYSSEAEAAAAGVQSTAVAAETGAAGAEVAATGAEAATAAAETGAQGAGWLARTGNTITIRARALASSLKSAPRAVFTSMRNLAQRSPDLVRRILATLSTPTAQTIIKGAALTELGIDLVSIMQAAPPAVGAAVTGEPDNAPDQKAALAICRSLHQEAKNWTPESAELKIAATLLKLNPASWNLINSVWNKNYKSDGTLYDYCIGSELSGDLLTLVDGYVAGLGGQTDASGKVGEYKAELKATAIAPGESLPIITESASIKSFNAFLKSRR